MGLSPRVRGNLIPSLIPSGDGRSIPARAGEPIILAAVAAQERVYPRACGGTLHSCATSGPAGGLSPRVRGNRVGHSPNPRRYGSIPARAGEPSTRCPAPRALRVYPRACGGTMPDGEHSNILDGLSPRVRGNLRVLPVRHDPIGSIPARAGEPPPAYPQRTRCRVYPRACGGTRVARDCWRLHSGLSPRVRGNLGVAHRSNAVDGSIPARAGEPLRKYRRARN